VSRPQENDWRRTGQEQYLKGLRLSWKRFQAYSGNWDHEHCEFCWRKFLDKDYAPWMREALATEASEYAGYGFTNVRQEILPGGRYRYWICRECFDDFRLEFGWAINDSDPQGWPYDPPEPRTRPTASDFDPNAGSRGP